MSLSCFLEFQSPQPVPVNSSKEQVQLKHGTQATATWQPKLSALPLLYSWALVLLEWVRQKKKSFPPDIPARQLQNLNLDEIWVSTTGELQLEKVSYAILTTKTSENITNLLKPHNALSTQTSLPLHLNRCLSANSQVSQPGASAEAPPLHIWPAQLRIWASCSHN